MSRSLDRAAFLRGRFAATVQEPAGAGRIAEILGHCLSVRGVTCRVCAEHCEPRAIAMRLLPGGRALPLVDAGRCDGCGECAGVCPAGAVNFMEAPA